MNKSAFLSYSWKDIPIVVRIYTDLVRSGLTIWRDEFSANYGKNYELEISNAFKKVNAILIMDSPNSRQSKYVQEECRLLSDPEWTNSQKKIAVCLIDDLQKTRSFPEVFPRQNKIKHFDFSNQTLFDNERCYLTSIRDLCIFFDLEFNPLFSDSSEKDFEDEISHTQLKDHDRKILIDEYQLIQKRLYHAFPGTLERLELFLEDCSRVRAGVSSPQLQLAIESLKSGNLLKSKDVLDKYVKTFSDDPRGWRCYGTVLSELKIYEQALDAFNHALKLLMDIKYSTTETIRFNNKKNLDYLLDVKINRATTLANQNKWECIAVYEEALNDDSLQSQILPDHFVLAIAACDHFKEEIKRLEWITRGLNRFSGNYQLNLIKTRLLAEKGQYLDALEIYRYLIFREIDDLEVYGECLSLLKVHGTNSEFQSLLIKALSFKPNTDKELYYSGYFNFLGGNVQIATRLFLQSKYELPFYDKLIN
jgi:tetratricopeptide (TPR) repeat protein